MHQYTVFSSDPTGKDLVVVGEDGTKIENILEMVVRGTGGRDSLMEVELTILGVALNVKATMHSVTFLCPNCQQYVGHDCD